MSMLCIGIDGKHYEGERYIQLTYEQVKEIDFIWKNMPKHMKEELRNDPRKIVRYGEYGGHLKMLVEIGYPDDEVWRLK